MIGTLLELSGLYDLAADYSTRLPTILLARPRIWRHVWSSLPHLGRHADLRLAEGLIQVTSLGRCQTPLPAGEGIRHPHTSMLQNPSRTR